ncbi:MAG: transposase [Pseudomonadota bacterium]
MFDTLEWLAAMCSHIPNKGEQMVRYYGYYSNAFRGKRKKQNQDEWLLLPRFCLKRSYDLSC